MAHNNQKDNNISEKAIIHGNAPQDDGSEKERSVDKLARYIMWLLAAGAVVLVCWYLRSILVYIVAAVVVSLLGRPLMSLLRLIKIKGKSLPAGLLTVVTLLIIMSVFVGIITQLFPVIFSIVQTVTSNMRSNTVDTGSLETMIAGWNAALIRLVPSLGPDFTLQGSIANMLSDIFDTGKVTSMVGSVASALGSFAIGIFATLFISFFFIKDESLFGKIIAALVPDHLEGRAMGAIASIEHLLSRYFVGLLTEILGVATLNFLGLMLLPKIDASAALGIAFITGLLNVIPYVGPWIGAGIGTVLGIVLKYSTAYAAGAPMDALVMVALLIAVFVFTQLVDNFIFQPLIYSTSIKSTPLECFIVLLVAGNIGGIFGMLVAIPAYTVVRVVAAEFFYNYKPIRRLMPEREAVEGAQKATSLLQRLKDRRRNGGVNAKD